MLRFLRGRKVLSVGRVIVHFVRCRDLSIHDGIERLRNLPCGKLCGTKSLND